MIGLIKLLRNQIYVLAVLLITTQVFAKVTFKDVEYSRDGKTFLGFIASPEGLNKKTPVIIMVHNWRGVTDETKKQAARFVELGYQVFAADIYGKDIRPKDAKESGATAKIYKTDRVLFRKHLQYALDAAISQANVDTNKVAAIGYCFGGTGVLELARTGANIKTAISFHGGLDSLNPNEAKNIKSRILALHGADDPNVPVKDVDAFEKEMIDYKVTYKIVKYPGAVHSFTDVGAGNDNSKGSAYNKEADEKSFVEAKNELSAAFK